MLFYTPTRFSLYLGVARYFSQTDRIVLLLSLEVLVIGRLLGRVEQIFISGLVETQHVQELEVETSVFLLF